LATNVLAPLHAALFTRFLYCLALFAFLPAAVRGSSGWIGLALGGGLAGGTLTGLLILVALIVFRTYQVLRYPAALDARPPNGLGKVLRYVGLFAMLTGIVAAAGLFFVKPLTLALFNSAGETGIGYFVVGLSLVVLANATWLGCLTFELSRICGPELPPEMAKPWSKRPQDLAVLGTLAAAAIVAPHLVQHSVPKLCGEANLASCISTTEGGVHRMIGLPQGEPIVLETSIAEIEMRHRSSERTASLRESPAVSLKVAGHPVAAAPDGRVRIRLDASSSSKDVLLTLVVFDGADETARFITRFDKGAVIEKTPTGDSRIVVDMPANAQPGLRSVYDDSGSRKRYALDQVFIQLRSAIGTEIEAREWPIRMVRPASLIASRIPFRLAGVEERFSKGPVDTACDGKLARERTTIVAFDRDIGWPLQGATFKDASAPGPHALFSSRDRVLCRDGEVWIVSYPVRRPELRLRRYASDGRLLRFVETKIPSADLGDSESDRIDPESVREDNGRIRFERVVIRHAIGFSFEKRRESFEIAL